MARLLGYARRHAKARADELLEAFGLADAAGRQVKNYSGGMRRRLDIAASIVVTPRLMILDEPTTGLDPRSRRTMWDIVRALVADGVTILLTTQYLDEADQLADRIGVLDGGHLVAEGTADELKRLVPGNTFHLTFRDRPELESAAATLPGAIASPETLTLAVPSDGSLRSLRAVLGRLDDASIDAHSCRVTHSPAALTRSPSSVSLLKAELRSRPPPSAPRPRARKTRGSPKPASTVFSISSSVRRRPAARRTCFSNTPGTWRRLLAGNWDERPLIG